MKPEDVVTGVGVLLLAWLAYRALRFIAPHDAYVRGDAVGTAKFLDQEPLSLRLALLTALGRYADATALARRHPELMGPPADLNPMALLARINAAEAFAELGDLHVALDLLEFETGDDRFLLAGQRNARAWTLSLAGRDAEALELVTNTDLGELGPDYVAEGFLTWALIRMNLDGAGVDALLEACRARTARASTERNLLLLEARWHALQGRLDDASRCFDQARNHRWRRQGATSLLRLGDAFAKAGAIELAGAAWRLAPEWDPEAQATSACLVRLAGLQPIASQP
ncbi:MAG: hypothetical protein SFW67_09450 [Myxococcaceae bacterium]|nr:hypothetical protein [Myxococcaceae bacterium]